jgi:hypothetical protein
MSEPVDTGWLISRKGWENMATRPKPYLARTEAERDWYLRNSMEADQYDVTPVGAVSPERHD